MSRWPLEPLMALARNRDGERMSMVELSKKLGWSETTVQGWQKRGIPSDEKAEAAAVAIGFDPANVWGEEWTQAQIDRYSVRCVECQDAFVPSRRGVKFCSKQCRWRHNKRRSYDPARKSAQNARYRQECADYVRAWARKYRAEHAEQIRENRRARYQRDGERERERNRAYYQANREAQLEYQRQYRARKKAEA